MTSMHELKNYLDIFFVILVPFGILSRYPHIHGWIGLEKISSDHN